MSPIGLLCVLVFNGVLVTVAILVCFAPASGGRDAVMPAALASLLLTFFLERLVPNVDPRLLSLRAVKSA